MHCGNCGAELKEGAVFCPNCGTKVEYNANPVVSEQVKTKETVGEVEKRVEEINKNIEQEKYVAPIKQQNEKIKKEKKKGGFLGKLILFLLILLIAFAALAKFVVPKFEFLQNLPVIGQVSSMINDVKLPSVPLPQIGGGDTSKGEEVGAYTNQYKIFYEKNNSVYDVEGKEDAEALTKNVTQNLYLNEKTNEYYFIKNDTAVCKIVKDEQEQLKSGQYTPTLLYPIGKGCSFIVDSTLYIDDGNEVNKIGSITWGPGSTVSFDVNNEVLYYMDDNNVYKVDEKCEKEKVTSNAIDLYFVQNQGLVIEKDDGIYLYKDDEVEKIITDEGIRLHKPNYLSNLNGIYLYKYLGNTKKATDFINDGGDYNVASALTNIDITNAIYDYDLYVYDFKTKEYVNIDKGVNTDYYTDSHMLVYTKPLVSNNKIDFNTISINPGNEYNDIKNAVSKRLLAGKDLIYAVRGTDRTLIQLEDDKYVEKNMLGSDIYIRNGMIALVYGDLLYVGKLNFNDVTKLTNVDKNVNNIYKVTNNGSVYYGVYGDSLMCYDGNKTKEIGTNVLNKTLEKGNDMYIITDYSSSDNEGTLYKVDMETNEKEKIKNSVSNLYYGYVNSSRVYNENMNIDSVKDFDEQQIFDEYANMYLKTGWGTDDNGQQVYYNENFEIVTNQDIKIDNEWYHMDGYGHPVKDQWVGDYYYGLDGKLLVDQWIGDYYVGKDGAYVKNQMIGTSYVDASGKKVYNRRVGSYYFDANGNFVTNTVINGVTYGADGKEVYVYVPPETTYAYSGGGNTSSSGTSSSTNSDKELYIKETLVITDEYDDGDKTCKITGRKPVVGGQNSDEVDNINSWIEDEIMDELMSALEEIARSYSEAPKTVTISKAEVTSLGSSKFRITLTGKVTPRSGSSKNIKFRMSYDRDEQEMVLENLT